MSAISSHMVSWKVYFYGPSIGGKVEDILLEEVWVKNSSIIGYFGRVPL